MIDTIYLDMDGVLSSFEDKFAERFGYPSMTVRDRKNFSEEWPTFVQEGLFEELEWFPGAKELLEFIESVRIGQGINIEILSSSGGQRFHGEVTYQKINWLKAHDIHYKANIVPGRKFKAAYASPTKILIDDTEPIITDFNAAGGHGILHRNVGETISRVKDLLAK